MKVNHWMGEPKGSFGPNAEKHEYVSLTSGGIKEQGAPARLYDDPVEAIRAYADQLENATRYASDVVWRELPTIEMTSLGFFVYSRLYVKRDTR